MSLLRIEIDGDGIAFHFMRGKSPPRLRKLGTIVKVATSTLGVKVDEDFTVDNDAGVVRFAFVDGVDESREDEVYALTEKLNAEYVRG